MKKTNLLLIIFFVGLSFFSCSSDDDNSNTTQNNLLGEWILVNQIYDGQNEELSVCELQETLTFNSNGTLISYYTDLDPCEFFSETQHYELNDDDLKIMFGEDSEFRYNVLILTESNLSIENYYRNGTTLDENNRTTYVYEKVN